MSRDCRSHVVGAMSLAAIAVAILVAGPAAAQSTLPADLVPVRAALDKYRDPVLAVHDGYFSTVGCMEFPEAGSDGQMQYPKGAMGVHFLNPALVGPTLDPMKPQVLIYAPKGDKLELVAAEWFVPLATGVKERPVLFGQSFGGPMEGHHPLMPASMTHYDLHVWLWRDNPEGLFSPTNPAVKCPAGGYTMAEKPPKIVGHAH